MATIDEALLRLQKSAFRSKFHLTDKDREYVKEKGLDKIREHCQGLCQGMFAKRVPEK